MKMDTSYMCSLHIWNMKFCCILGDHSFIQQVIASRNWSSSLFTRGFFSLWNVSKAPLWLIVLWKVINFYNAVIAIVMCPGSIQHSLLQSHKPKTPHQNPTKQNPHAKPNKTPKQTILADKMRYSVSRLFCPIRKRQHKGWFAELNHELDQYYSYCHPSVISGQNCVCCTNFF